MAETPDTPCIAICSMDRASGLCAGCGRTLDEIAGWIRMTPDARRVIMAALPQRMIDAGLTPPARK